MMRPKQMTRLGIAAALVWLLPHLPGNAAEENGNSAQPTGLRVAVAPLASAIEWSGQQPTGVMIDIWEDLAGRLGKPSDFVKVPTFAAIMGTLTGRTVDVALGPIAITEERERQFDLTHPIFHSGLRIAVRQKTNAGFFDALESLVSLELLELLGIVVVLALLSGHLLWWFERKGNDTSFPREYPRGVWEATWWIASTIVSGGCDDKHVDSVLGRALAYSWMVGGIVLIAAFTSMLTATMTAERVTGTIHGVRDLANRTVGCQAGAVSADSVRRRGGNVEKFESLHEALDALGLGMVDAVVGENQQMMYLTNQSNRQTIRLVGPIFDSFDYGLGLPAGSPLREDLNNAILRMREDGTLDRIKEEWFGRHE
jgi:polar amino acid transport system substrate-binding protein